MLQSRPLATAGAVAAQRVQTRRRKSQRPLALLELAQQTPASRQSKWRRFRHLIAFCLNANRHWETWLLMRASTSSSQRPSRPFVTGWKVDWPLLFVESTRRDMMLQTPMLHQLLEWRAWRACGTMLGSSTVCRTGRGRRTPTHNLYRRPLLYYTDTDTCGLWLELKLIHNLDFIYIFHISIIYNYIILLNIIYYIYVIYIYYINMIYIYIIIWIYI